MMRQCNTCAYLNYPVVEEPCLRCDGFGKYVSVEYTVERINQLEAENTQLKEELERLRMQLYK